MILRNKLPVIGILKTEDNIILWGEHWYGIYDHRGCLLGSNINIKNLQKILTNGKHFFLVCKEKIKVLEKFAILDDLNDKEIEKNNLDQVVLTENRLYIIQKDSISHYLISRIEIKTTYPCKNGLCVGFTYSDGLYYLAFENGTVNILQENENMLLRILINIHKLITCFDISQDIIILGTFCNSIYSFELDGSILNEITLENHPLIVKVWNRYICILDSENNLILFDFNLKLIHVKNYNGLLQSFDVLHQEIVLMYTTGTVFIGNTLPQIM